MLEGVKDSKGKKFINIETKLWNVCKYKESRVIHYFLLRKNLSNNKNDSFSLRLNGKGFIKMGKKLNLIKFSHSRRTREQTKCTTYANTSMTRNQFVATTNL